MEAREIIPWVISAIMLIFTILTYTRNGRKESKNDEREMGKQLEGMRVSLVTMDLKLNQLCSTTLETRTDIKSIYKDLQNMDKRVTDIEHDIKTAFHRIEEIEKKGAQS